MTDSKGISKGLIDYRVASSPDFVSSNVRDLPTTLGWLLRPGRELPRQELQKQIDNQVVDVGGGVGAVVLPRLKGQERVSGQDSSLSPIVAAAAAATPAPAATPPFPAAVATAASAAAAGLLGRAGSAPALAAAPEQKM